MDTSKLQGAAETPKRVLARLGRKALDVGGRSVSPIASGVGWGVGAAHDGLLASALSRREKGVPKTAEAPAPRTTSEKASDAARQMHRMVQSTGAAAAGHSVKHEARARAFRAAELLAGLQRAGSSPTKTALKRMRSAEVAR